MSDKAKTEKVSPGIDQIPFESLEALGDIFVEGEEKYGRDNWKRGVDDIPFQRERARHARRHLYLWVNGDRSEPHLAKVMWFCVIQIWLDKQKPVIPANENKSGPFFNPPSIRPHIDNPITERNYNA